MQEKNCIHISEAVESFVFFLWRMGVKLMKKKGLRISGNERNSEVLTG